MTQDSKPLGQAELIRRGLALVERFIDACEQAAAAYERAVEAQIDYDTSMIEHMEGFTGLMKKHLRG